MAVSRIFCEACNRIPGGAHTWGALPAAPASGAAGDLYASRRIPFPTALVDRPAGEKTNLALLEQTPHGTRTCTGHSGMK